MELRKKDKKVARQIIEIGLMREFAIGLSKADAVITDWKENAKDNRESYHALFRTVREFDKHIARRYDRMTGSRYGLIVAVQLYDGVISEDELGAFSEEARTAIINYCRAIE